MPLPPINTSGLREEQPTVNFPLFCLNDDLALKVASLMENTADWIYFKDLNSRFTLVSASLIQQLTGTRKASVLGKTDSDFFEDECAEKIYEDDRKVLNSGEAIHGKVELVVFNDESRWMSTSKMPLRDDTGNIVGLMGISRDITNEKQVEQELKEVHQAMVETSRQAGMAEVATSVIHNVGNVLNSINVSTTMVDEIAKEMKFDKLDKVTELLRSNLESPDFFAEGGKGRLVPEYLKGVTESLKKDNQTLLQELASTRKHLEHVCNVISRQQQFACNLQCVESVELSELVEDALRLSGDSLKRYGIDLIRDYEPGLLIEVDKRRVLQIVVNLLRNAKHACVESDKEKREIRLTVGSNGKSDVVIKVQDNGIGIASENLVKLFSHGFTTRKHGHGFGLHSGANSAKQMNGSLTCHSDGIGTGATFALTLPRMTSA